jgi:hypothetical protein
MGFASAVLAQGLGGRVYSGLMELVSMEEVQKELSITAARVEKSAALQGDRSSQENFGREDRPRRSEELAKTADKQLKRSSTKNSSTAVKTRHSV